MQETTSTTVYQPNQWIRIAVLRNLNPQRNRTPVITLGFSDQVVQFSPLLVPDPYGTCANFIHLVGGASYKLDASILSKIRIAGNDAEDRAIDIQLSTSSPVSVSIEGASDWVIQNPPLANPTEEMMNSINELSFPASLGFHGTLENNATLLPDGTLICTKAVEVANLAIATPWGSIYENASSIAMGEWLVPFCAPPTVSYNYVASYGNAFVETNNKASETDAGNVYLTRPNQLTISGKVQVTAVGRWYVLQDLNTD